MANIFERLRILEGTIEYQKYKGYYRSGKFYIYKDSLGYPTIGYGHLVQKGENFTNGISPVEADRLLEKDVAIARLGVASLGLGKLDQDIEDYLVLMVFQLGLVGTQKFKKLLAAAKAGDRAGMIRESKDSLWFKQTPNRVHDLNNNLNK
ncbi:glycoside hydrolase family protein [Klebsiella aerogenes]